MIPLITNYVNILRLSNATQDPYDEPVYVTVASGVGCVLGSKGGSANEVGGDQETVNAQVIFPEGTDVRRSDRVVDPNLGETWEVQWSRARVGLGLDHVKVGLKQVTGEARV